MDPEPYPEDKVIHPVVTRLSFVLAGVACAMLVTSLVVRLGEHPAWVPVAAGFAWLTVFGVTFFSCLLMARFLRRVSPSHLMRPGKERQARLLQGPMVWWIHAMVLLLPIGVAVAALLILFGALPSFVAD